MDWKNERPGGRGVFSLGKRWLWGLAAGSLLLSSGAGAIVAWVTWRHNPQEHHSGDHLGFSTLLNVFGSTFLLVFSLCCVAFISFGITSWILWRFFARRRQVKDDSKAE